MQFVLVSCSAVLITLSIVQAILLKFSSFVSLAVFAWVTTTAVPNQVNKLSSCTQ